jgi:hypothetical protein
MGRTCTCGRGGIWIQILYSKTWREDLVRPVPIYNVKLLFGTFSISWSMLGIIFQDSWAMAAAPAEVTNPRTDIQFEGIFIDENQFQIRTLDPSAP